MQQQNIIQLIGYACGIAAGDTRCGDGPLYAGDLTQKLIDQGLQANWLKTLQSISLTDKYEIIKEICTRLAIETEQLVQHQNRFCIIGGDHSSAIGTWSGVARALRNQGDIGLIWVDAHLDSHTPETSESGNIHGMPLAALLGYGDSRLTQIADSAAKVKANNVCIIGARSFEAGEKKLLEQLGVRIFYMEEINQRSLATVFVDAIKLVSQATIGYGLSIDLDALDPTQAPGVGSPAENGIDSAELMSTLQLHCCNDNHLLGCEIAEFNPYKDENSKTGNLIKDLLLAIYKG